MLKLSPGKATLPGAKQVWRRVEAGRFAGDVIALADEPGPEGAMPLLEPAMAGGRRASATSRSRRRASERQRSAPRSRRSTAASTQTPYPVEIGEGLAELRDALADQIGH